MDTIPAQWDAGELIAHPAAVLKFLGVDVMVQRSVIDGKVLVTIDGDDKGVRIDLNDATVWDGPGIPTDITNGPPQRRDIADNPAAIADHLASFQSAVSKDGERISTIHLRPVGDGYWTRLRLITVRQDREFCSTLVLDHHRTPPYGEEAARQLNGAMFGVRSVDARGWITAAGFERAHADAAKVLVAYPEAIATLLGRNQP
jgi:hypothetical protein